MFTTDHLILINMLLSVITLASVLYLAHPTTDERPNDAPQHDTTVTESVSGDASIISPHILEREEAYDQRILRMKSELANQRVDARDAVRVTEDAKEYDPDVKNLPHESVNHLINKQGIEVSE